MSAPSLDTFEYDTNLESSKDYTRERSSAFMFRIKEKDYLARHTVGRIVFLFDLLQLVVLVTKKGLRGEEIKS